MTMPHAAGKKKEGALHTDRPVFEFPNYTAEFPNQLPGMSSGLRMGHATSLLGRPFAPILPFDYSYFFKPPIFALFKPFKQLSNLITLTKFKTSLISPKPV